MSGAGPRVTLPGLPGTGRGRRRRLRRVEGRVVDDLSAQSCAAPGADLERLEVPLRRRGSAGRSARQARSRSARSSRDSRGPRRGPRPRTRQCCKKASTSMAPMPRPWKSGSTARAQGHCERAGTPPTSTGERATWPTMRSRTRATREANSAPWPRSDSTTSASAVRPKAADLNLGDGLVFAGFLGPDEQLHCVVLCWQFTAPSLRHRRGRFLPLLRRSRVLEARGLFSPLVRGEYRVLEEEGLLSPPLGGVPGLRGEGGLSPSPRRGPRPRRHRRSAPGSRPSVSRAASPGAQQRGAVERGRPPAT